MPRFGTLKIGLVVNMGAGGTIFRPNRAHSVQHSRSKGAPVPSNNRGVQPIDHNRGWNSILGSSRRGLYTAPVAAGSAWKLYAP